MNPFVSNNTAPQLQVSRPKSELGNILTPSLYNTWQSSLNESLYNQNLNQWQWQNQIDLLNYQNQYNSPAEQMARYREAGLNPHFAQSNSGNMTAQSVPSAQMANSPDYSKAKYFTNYLQEAAQLASIVASVGTEFHNFQKTDAEVNNLNALTQSTLWNTDRSKNLFQFDKLTAEHNAKLAYENALGKSLENATFGDRLAMAQNLNAAQIDKIRSDILRSEELLPYEKRKAAAEIDQLIHIKQNLKKQGKLLDKDYQYYDERFYGDFYGKGPYGFLFGPLGSATRQLGDKLNNFITNHSLSSTYNKLVSNFSKGVDKASEALKNASLEGNLKDSSNRLKKAKNQPLPAGIYNH